MFGIEIPVKARWEVPLAAAYTLHSDNLKHYYIQPRNTFKAACEAAEELSKKHLAVSATTDLPHEAFNGDRITFSVKR